MNNNNDIKISVCLCTFKRPQRLYHCLQSLLQQSLDVNFEVVLIDNDASRSGEPVYMQLQKSFQKAGLPFSYITEPIQNIALARNRSLQHASGEYVAFIDDDECASTHWLKNLLLVMIKTEADGVWGPVIPRIPESFPTWMQRSNLFERENPGNLSTMKDHGLRTSNALLKRSLLNLRVGPFDASLGRIGGSDYDLFNWLRQNDEKLRFIWSSNAEVFECVEEKRRHLKWHMRRAYRGGWGYSRGLVQRFGTVSGFLLSAGRVIPSTVFSLFTAAYNLSNVKLAGFIIIRTFANNLGKLGYFMGVDVEEYQG